MCISRIVAQSQNTKGEGQIGCQNIQYLSSILIRRVPSSKTQATATTL